MMTYRAKVLTFELPQKPGQGMQRSRSSTAFWHSRLGSSRKQTRICCVESSTLFSPPEDVDLIPSVYIHGHIQCTMLFLRAKCSHLSFRRDQAEACSASDPRLPSGRADWEVAESRLEFTASKAAS